MKENFEIEKELKFNSNLAEIISISIEEKHEIKDSRLIGNFVVSGEYKIHEISLNKEKFSFKIPYEYELKSDLDVDTVKVNITNFIYDNDNEFLYVTISYDVLADRKDILLFDDEEDLDEFLKSREVELVIDDTINQIDNVLEKEEVNVNKKFDDIIEDNESIIDDELEERQNKVLETNERNIEKAKENLLKSVKVEDDTYITYKIHIVKETDTLDSILNNYSMSLDELKEYNEFNNLSLGDKLIIPLVHEK